MKNFFAFLSLLIVIPVLFSCGSIDDRENKEDIFTMVTENSNLFLECINNNDLSELLKFNQIKEINTEDDCIDFYCGGSGFGSSTAYVGFYYSETENLKAIWCAPLPREELIPDGNGYRWKEKSGDNRYYVEKICDGFYYYEASF